LLNNTTAFMIAVILIQFFWDFRDGWDFRDDL
jgi:hypothetical protein